MDVRASDAGVHKALAVLECNRKWAYGVDDMALGGAVPRADGTLALVTGAGDKARA